MKKIKIILWSVPIAFFALLIYQNQELFFSRQTLGINVYFVNYRTPEILNIIYYLCFFVLGFIISFLFGLPKRFRSKKMIKSLNQTIESNVQTISELKGTASPPKEIAPFRISDPAVK